MDGNTANRIKGGRARVTVDRTDRASGRLPCRVTPDGVTRQCSHSRMNFRGFSGIPFTRTS